ncbi:MuDR family transposase [Melia azedarach]|uniref:MuDR family transposase n=1 Tax=Melia azedarach TaxID=155640 RepID=A0ACC1XXS0_MELAZ|nr:MuDR family transposase [Melia azedarach]
MHPAAAKYLEDDVGIHMWARSQFPSRRYDMQTTNIPESLNSLLRHARNLPVIALIEYIRSVIQRWFYERRELATVRERYLTNSAQAKIDEQTELSRTMNVYPALRFEFEVKDKDKVDIVDIQEKTCSCGYFQLQQLPCAHALAVCRHIRLSHHSLCSNY